MKTFEDRFIQLEHEFQQRDTQNILQAMRNSQQNESATQVLIVSLKDELRVAHQMA